MEEFKYTDLRALLREVAPFAGVPTADEAKAVLDGSKAFADVTALQVPFVNGHFVREAVDFAKLPVEIAWGQATLNPTAIAASKLTTDPVWVKPPDPPPPPKAAAPAAPPKA